MDSRQSRRETSTTSVESTTSTTRTKELTTSLTSAWNGVHGRWRLGALIVAGLALQSIRSDVVPAASGVTVAALVIAALVDLHERRLPNRLVYGAGGAFAVMLLVSRVAADPAATGHTGIVEIGTGALVMSGPLLAMHVVSPPSMGLGDVKAAVVLGAALGAVDWRLALTALAAGAGLSAAVGLIARVRTIPFGPGLVAGAALTLAFPAFPVDPAVGHEIGFGDVSRGAAVGDLR